MAHQPIALNLHAKKKCVIVAIRRRGHDSQAIAAGFALHPKLLASAAPKSHEACFYCLGIAFRIQKAQHQDLPGSRVLHDAGDEAVHFVKIDLGLNAHHLSISSVYGAQAKSPSAWSPAGFVGSDLSGPLLQAITVRRHGGPMVVVTVMAVALHLSRS